MTAVEEPKKLCLLETVMAWPGPDRLRMPHPVLTGRCQVRVLGVRPFYGWLSGQRRTRTTRWTRRWASECSSSCRAAGLLGHRKIPG